jgi:hypothetical protein
MSTIKRQQGKRKQPKLFHLLTNQMRVAMAESGLAKPAFVGAHEGSKPPDHDERRRKKRRARRKMARASRRKNR